MSPKAPDWVEPLCRIAFDFTSSSLSIRDLFTQAAPDLNDPKFVEQVLTRLQEQPDLVQAWQQYSYDKRGTPSPFLDGSKVGFAEVLEERLLVRDVHTHKSAAEACAEFICREALWVLEGREAM